jgi:hypothetical protein
VAVSVVQYCSQRLRMALFGPMVATLRFWHRKNDFPCLPRLFEKRKYCWYYACEVERLPVVERWWLAMRPDSRPQFKAHQLHVTMSINVNVRKQLLYGKTGFPNKISIFLRTIGISRYLFFSNYHAILIRMTRSYPAA